MVAIDDEGASRWRLLLIFVLLISVVFGSSAAHAQQGAETGPELRTIVHPAEDPGIASLPDRQRSEEEDSKRRGPRLDFRFTDRVVESRITFVHRIVDDAGSNYKEVHYDHGNGLSVADVDGDGLLDVYFLTQLGSNELWRNAGGGRFENITNKAGVGVELKIGVAASFADIDNDGDPDLYVTTANMGNILFENRGEGRFEDISKASGLDHIGHSSGVLFLDYNRDGLLDLLLTNIGRYTYGRLGRGGYYLGLEDAFSGHLYPERYERSQLFENRGDKTFVDVTEQVGFDDTGWAGDAAFTDFDRDGYPDLYVLNMQGDDHYHANLGGRRFEERTAELFPKTPWGAMGIAVFDYDNNGRMDIYITDMHSDMSEMIGPEREKLKSRMQWPDDHLQGGANNIFGNALYQQGLDGSFTEVSDAVGVENYWPWGVSSGDVNADGFEDLFVTASMNFPFRYQPNSLLINDGGREFLERSFVLAVEPRSEGKTHVEWFEIDCSGADRRRGLCRDKQGRFVVMGTMGSRSSAIFDLDDDGDLDIVTNEFNARPQVLMSGLAEHRKINLLKVRLIGTRSNRDGLGAFVTVHTPSAAYTRLHTGKSGYLSQSSMPLYFGLGEEARVERIEVLWPQGGMQTVSPPIELGSVVEIVEEESPPAL